MMDVKRSMRDITDLLAFLRRGIPDYERALQTLDREMRASGLSLAEVGTSEKELEALRVLGCRAAAEMWLGSLRSPDHMEAENSIFKIRHELHKGGLALDIIGTSEEQLELLRIASVTNLAKLYLDGFRKCKNGGVTSVELFRALLATASLTLAAVGTSEAELSEFSLRYSPRQLSRAA